MKLTKRDHEQRVKYNRTRPKQLGNLHERMKLLVAICTDRHLWEDNDLWQALLDLATEISMHAPADPPFGHRTQTLGEKMKWDRVSQRRPAPQKPHPKP